MSTAWARWRRSNRWAKAGSCASQTPRALARFLAFKGSITVNGVSLTVNRVRDTAAGCEISINLIPHTLHNTALGSLQRGCGSTWRST